MSVDTAVLAERILAAQTELMAIAAELQAAEQATVAGTVSYVYVRQAGHTLDLALAALDTPQ